MAIVQIKFLLDRSIEEILKNQKNSTKINQFYTKIRFCEEVRYQKADNSYFKIIRTGSDVRKNITDKKISKASYRQAKRKKIGSLLKKRRYTIRVEDQELTIDKYYGKLKNLYLLKKDFHNLQEQKRFHLPHSLREYVESDLSHNNRYRNKNLALLGNPKRVQYELYKIYKDIQNKKILNSIPFKQMCVEDFVKIVLYKNYIDILETKDKFIKSRSIETLKHLQKVLNDTKIILKEFRYVFKEERFNIVYKNFCTVKKSIFIDEEIDILKHNMPLLESVMDDKNILKFIKMIDQKVEKRKNNIYKFIHSREFNIILNQFELLLKEPNSINQNNYADINIYLQSKKSIKRAFKKFGYLSKKFDKCYDLKSYQKINKSLYRLELFINLFAPFYEVKKLNKIKHTITSTEKSLNNFIYLSKDISIIKDCIQDSSHTIGNKNKSIKRVMKNKKELEKRYNANIDTRIKNLKNHKSSLLP